MRPQRYDKSVVKVAVMRHAQEFYDYCDADSSNPQSALDEITDDVIDAVGYYEDGFKVAMALCVRHYWDGSMNLAELCERVCNELYEVHNVAVREWAKTSEVVATHVVGDVVKYRGENHTVTKLYDEIKSYVLRGSKHGVDNGYIVEWEKIP